MMRCYNVLVHAMLEWRVPASTPDEAQPLGLYNTRHVLAQSEQKAAQKACAKVAQMLDRKIGSNARVTCEADEVTSAPLWRLLMPSRGLVFYSNE